MRHFRVTLLVVALAFLTYDGLALAGLILPNNWR